MKRPVRSLILTGNIITLTYTSFLSFGYMFTAFFAGFIGRGVVRDTFVLLSFLFSIGVPFNVIGIVSSVAHRGKFHGWSSIVSLVYAISMFLLEIIRLLTSPPNSTTLLVIEIALLILLAIAIAAFILGIQKSSHELDANPNTPPHT